MFANLKKMFGVQDMTTGKPLYNLAAFSIPLLIGNIAQQLYNTVDSIIVGKCVGDTALAAVGTSMPILNLLLLLFMGISTGAGIMVSQYFGAKRTEDLNQTIGTCLTLTLIASVIIMIVGPIITPPLMSLLNTPPEVYEMAVDYLTIIFLGIIGTGYYNIVSGILRGMGDSVSPLIFLVVAAVLNIFLDLWFVAGLGMTADGVALATVIAQLVSAVLCILKLMKMKGSITINRKTLKPDREMTRSIIRLGLPSGLTQAIFSMAAIVVQSLTNSFGTNVIACSNVVMRVDGFAMMPNFTFGMAMTTYVGQNIGAKLMKRVDEGVKVGLIAGVAISAVLVSAILIFGEGLLRMFTTTEEVIQLGVRMLRILALGYIAMAVTQSLSGVMRGAGDTMTPMWISIITTVIIRMPLAYLWAALTKTEALPTGSPDSIFCSLLISWVLGAVFTFFAFRKGAWRNKALKDRA